MDAYLNGTILFLDKIAIHKMALGGKVATQRHLSFILITCCGYYYSSCIGEINMVVNMLGVVAHTLILALRSQR